MNRKYIELLNRSPTNVVILSSFNKLEGIKLIRNLLILRFLYNQTHKLYIAM